MLAAMTIISTLNSIFYSILNLFGFGQTDPDVIEALNYQQKIIRALNRMEKNYRKETKSGTIFEQVQFKDTVKISSREVKLQVDLGQLPTGVFAPELSEDKVVATLSGAVNREVAAVKKGNRELWYVIRRDVPQFKKNFFYSDLRLPKGYESMAIPIPIGRNDNGDQTWYDLATMPHLLVAGATGNGKSSAMHSIICSIAQNCDPERVKMVGIDLKKVDHNRYSPLPHMLQHVAIELKSALDTIHFINDEIKRRETAYLPYGAITPAMYEKSSGRTMPRVVFFLDEIITFDELKGSDEHSEVMNLLRVGSGKARALGIHFIVSTQRPDVSVIDGTMKANFTYVIAFGTKDRIDSEVILKNDLAVGLEVGDCIFQVQKTAGERNFLLRSPFLNVENHESDEIITQILAKYHIEEQTKTREVAENRKVAENLLKGMFEFSTTRYKGEFSLTRIYPKFKMAIAKNQFEYLCLALEDEGLLLPGNGPVPRRIIPENVDNYSDRILDIIMGGSGKVEGEDDLKTKEGLETKENLPPFGSLIFSPGFNKRTDIRFLSARKWKRDEKENDIELLKFEKEQCKPETIKAIATDIISVYQKFQVQTDGCYVTAPPPGASAHLNIPHFATEIGKEVASRLGLEFITVFKPRPRQSSSSPKAYMDKVKIELDQKVEKNCLLIDDVATSGVTIVECTKLLRKNSSKVTSLAWIYGVKAS